MRQMTLREHCVREMRREARAIRRLLPLEKRQWKRSGELVARNRDRAVRKRARRETARARWISGTIEKRQGRLLSLLDAFKIFR